MIRFVLGIIKLYFTLGILFGLILFTSILYHYYMAERVTRSAGDVIGDALLFGVVRFFLWLPELWQAMVLSNQSFLEWLTVQPSVVY